MVDRRSVEVEILNFVAGPTSRVLSRNSVCWVEDKLRKKGSRPMITFTYM